MKEEGTLVHQGKVRDIYDHGDYLRLVATDRLSAFDRPIATIPHKAKVLNELSAWWFDMTKNIIDNHLIKADSPTSMCVRKCTVFPIEVVVRGYLTGTTNTSIWTLYEKGERQFFDTTLPDGLFRNQPLPAPILTPTTKEVDHDRPMIPEDIEQSDAITAECWAFISQKAIELFEFGQTVAKRAGLILVDTKFEFGTDENGNILLIDECLTPDSSRFWLAETYERNLRDGKEPDNFSKEFIRLWFKDHCDPYNDDTLPEAPPALIEEASRRYLDIYERLTKD